MSDDPNTWASVAVKNDFGTMIFNVKVNHRYDFDHIDLQSWDYIEKGTSSTLFDVGYWTGPLRTGKDYWWIQFEAYGKIWNCKGDFYCFLTGDDAKGDDAKKVVYLRIYRDGNNAKMEVQCPGSANCTVPLIRNENTQPDLSGWMGKYLPKLRGLTLGEIALPGSHDAGMYKVPNCNAGNPCNTQTQATEVTA